MDRSDSGLEGFLAVAFKYKYAVLAFFLFAMAGAMAAYFFYFRELPLIFEARALIMVNAGGGESGDSPLTARSQSDSEANTALASELSILTGRELKKKLLDTLGVPYVYPYLRAASGAADARPRDKALLRLERDLSVRPVNSSRLIAIAFQGNQGETSARVVNQLIGLYQEERIKLLAHPASAQPLEAKTAEYRDKVSEAEKKLEAFKSRRQVYSVDEETSALVQKRMSLENALGATQSQMKELQGKLAYVGDALQKTPPVPQVSASSREAMARLADLQARERDLASRYTDKNSFLVGVRAEIDTLRESLKKDGVSPDAPRDAGGSASDISGQLKMDRIKIQQQLTALEIQNTETRRRLSETEEQIRSLGLIANEFQDLQRELSLNEKNYETYVGKLEEARIADERKRLDMTTVSVVEAAVAPALPINPAPRLWIFLLLGAVAGLSGGTGAAFVLRFFRQTMISPAEVERRLNLPVLLSLPHRPGK
jgi:uncharacterized protein involved in exopolysaccharide biosynthesis